MLAAIHVGKFCAVRGNAETSRILLKRSCRADKYLEETREQERGLNARPQEERVYEGETVQSDWIRLGSKVSLDLVMLTVGTKRKHRRDYKSGIGQRFQQLQRRRRG